MTYEETLWIPRYGNERIGILVYKNGAPFDVDSDTVTAVITSYPTPGAPVSKSAIHESLGTYSVDLITSDTSVEGKFQVVWNYSIASVAQSQTTFIDVGPTSPDYLRLNTDLRASVEGVWMRLADLWDSPTGGPHLQVYFQTRFSRNRIAQLMRVAVGRMNTVAQPHQSYTIDGTGLFPVATWGPLLEQATFVEVIKHLIRSYVEQPEWPGVTVSRADRRDYMIRWGEVLTMEKADLDHSLSIFKIANMGLGRPSVLVAGGAYGNLASYGRLINPARPRYSSAWF